jgi:hypothetical protein
MRPWSVVALRSIGRRPGGCQPPWRARGAARAQINPASANVPEARRLAVLVAAASVTDSPSQHRAEIEQGGRVGPFTICSPQRLSPCFDLELDPSSEFGSGNGLLGVIKPPIDRKALGQVYARRFDLDGEKRFRSVIHHVHGVTSSGCWVSSDLRRGVLRFYPTPGWIRSTERIIACICLG